MTPADHPQTEQSGSEPVISVSMPKSAWKALLSVGPLAKETYTGEGEAIFNAFQAIHRAVNPDGPQ